MENIQPSLFERLHLKDEVSLLIMGAPSTIEKQFAKLSFARAVTPLIKIKKIDFALIFAVSRNQLREILKDVLPTLRPDAKLWIAYPKITSKIVSDLNTSTHWDIIDENGYDAIEQIAIDSVWTAIFLMKSNLEKSLVIDIELPENLSNAEVKQIVAKIALLADEKHRSDGGHGLKINDIKIEMLANVSKEVLI